MPVELSILKVRLEDKKISEFVLFHLSNYAVYPK